LLQTKNLRGSFRRDAETQRKPKEKPESAEGAESAEKHSYRRKAKANESSSGSWLLASWY
jgi:hypothetical protein